MIMPGPPRLGLKPGSAQSKAIRHVMQLFEGVGLHVSPTRPETPIPLEETVIDINAHGRSSEARIGACRTQRSCGLERPSTSRCHHGRMSEEGNESFEARVRAIARELSRSVERLAELDMDEVARTIGVDAERAKGLVDTAGRWFSAYAETFKHDVDLGDDATGSPAPAHESRRAAGPHPLDIPSTGQGLALSALDSGRWSVEPGSNLLVSDGEGPEPQDAVGLVGELRARDWIDANGEVTLVGHSALGRWLEANKAV